MNDQRPSHLPTEAMITLELSLIPGLGPQRVQRLFDQFGTAEAIWRQPRECLLKVPGVGDELAGAILGARDQGRAAVEWERCRGSSIEIVTCASPAYPQLLKQIHDPPTVLYRQGQVLPSDALAVAIVGTRHASAYGLRQATSLATSLARAGITVVSGLARGIDASAHRGAMAGGGRTLAVLAGGLLELYPPEHRRLAEEIASAGAVLSEVPLQTKPKRGAFPRRNRLISGLTLGVIIVEAARRSGAMITARHAMEQGRDVFAVPGPVDVRTSRGCHQLLRDGAKLVESVDDVLEELGPFVAPLPTADDQTVRHAAELRLNQLEQKVLHAIDDVATTVDQLVTRCELPVQRVLATLSVLETRRLITRVSGDRVQRRFATPVTAADDQDSSRGD